MDSDNPYSSPETDTEGQQFAQEQKSLFAVAICAMLASACSLFLIVDAGMARVRSKPPDTTQGQLLTAIALAVSAFVVGSAILFKGPRRSGLGTAVIAGLGAVLGLAVMSVPAMTLLLGPKG